MSPTINNDILCRLFKDAMTNQRRHSTPPLHGRYDQLQKTTPSLPLRKWLAYYAQYDPIKHKIKLNRDLLPLTSYSYKRRPNTYIYIRNEDYKTEAKEVQRWPQHQQPPTLQQTDDKHCYTEQMILRKQQARQSSAKGTVSPWSDARGFCTPRCPTKNSVWT